MKPTEPEKPESICTLTDAELIADLVEALEQLLSRVVEKNTWDKKAILVAKAALHKAKILQNQNTNP
jgi:hypothetical protein